MSEYEKDALIEALEKRVRKKGLSILDRVIMFVAFGGLTGMHFFAPTKSADHEWISKHFESSNVKLDAITLSLELIKAGNLTFSKQIDDHESRLRAIERRP